MKNTGKAASIAVLLMTPWTPVPGAESVQITDCSRPGSLISFTDLTTEGTVVSGAAVIPRAAEVSFSVKGSYKPFSSTTLRSYATINSLKFAQDQYVTVASGDLFDLSEVTFSRTFALKGNPQFPLGSLKASMSIVDADKKEVGCFEFPMKYVAE